MTRRFRKRLRILAWDTVTPTRERRGGLSDSRRYLMCCVHPSLVAWARIAAPIINARRRDCSRIAEPVSTLYRWMTGGDRISVGHTPDVTRADWDDADRGDPKSAIPATPTMRHARFTRRHLLCITFGSVIIPKAEPGASSAGQLPSPDPPIGRVAPMDPENAPHPSSSPSQMDRPRLRRKWQLEDPAAAAARGRWRRTFFWTGAIAAVVVAGGIWIQSGADQRAQRRVYRSAVEQDLLRLAEAQEAFHTARGRYGSLAELGIRYVSSQGVRVRVTESDSTGWNAAAWHLRTRRECTISVGIGPAAIPNRPSGEIACQ